MSTATAMAQLPAEPGGEAVYEFVPLSDSEIERWDEIARAYPDYEVFHRKAWLNYLAEAHAVTPQYWKILCGERCLGVFCGGLVRRGPFRIFGSPLKGWYTNCIGALLDPEADPQEFLRALERLARKENWAMLEIEQRGLPESLLSAAGFESTKGLTYWVPLSTDETEMMKRLHKGRRSGVKKAMKCGLTAEVSTRADIADDFYDRYSAMMYRKGLAPGFPRSHPRLLFKHIYPIDRLLGLRVRDPQGRVLAAGLFLLDNRTLYFWGGSDSLEGREFCPNDFLHWSAMCLAARRGMKLYDMSGYGRFKKEFGGQLLTLNRWHKAYWRSARLARGFYAAWHKQTLWVRALWGSVSALTKRTNGAEQSTGRETES